MDDLRSTLRDFDADAPLPAAPDPWDSCRHPSASDRAALGDGRDDRGRARRSPDRVAARLAADGSAAALAEAVRRAAAARRSRGRHRLRDVRARGARRGRDPSRRRGGSPGSPAAGRWRRRRSSSSLDPPADGLVIGVSHEGGTAATIAALAAARAAGAADRADHRERGVAGGRRRRTPCSATVELDRSWCHTVGYVSPIVAATVTADALAGRGGRSHGLGSRVRAGIEAAHGSGADGSRPDESIAARSRRRPSCW